MVYFQPFNYRFDGTFTRTTKAWHTDPATGLIHETAIDERRIVLRSLGAEEYWIWIEGDRENHILDPLDTSSVEWDTAAPGTTVLDTPDGEPGTPGLVNSSSLVEQIFDTGSRAASVSISGYVHGVGGSQTATILVSGGTPGTGVNQTAFSNSWARAKRENISLAAAGNKGLRIATNLAPAQMAVWGCVAESGPSWANARFASQPILETLVRAHDKYNAGGITQAMIDENPRSIRVRWRAGFESSQVVTGDAFTLAHVDTGVAGTSLVIYLDGTGTGAVRVRAGRPGGTLVSSGSITFFEGSEITAELVLATGELIVDGASGGNGTFTNGTYSIAADSAVEIGALSDGTAQAFVLIAPFELGYDDITVLGIDQLTLNSARVTFSHDVLMFDPNGVYDALNPANYEVSGTPGWPMIQSIGRGDTDADVILYFDAPIAPLSLLTIYPWRIVAAPVPIPVTQSVVSFIAFGSEVSAVVAAELALRRVDIANPQSPQDAGTDSLGTIPVTDAGDLENDSGRVGLRKRIYRRLSTVRDGFFHLTGYGLRPQDKTLITPTTLRQLQLNIEEQVQAEPGVVAVRIRLSEIASGVVAVRLTVEDDNGAFEMTGQLDFTGE